MNHRWRGITALTVLTAWVFCACAGCQWLSGTAETATPEPTSTENIPLTPSQLNDVQRKSFTMYFRYGQEPYLTGEVRMVALSEDKRVEQVILQEMIDSGPSAGSTQLEAVINPDTKVISVSDSQEYLFVTLSSDFLKPMPANAPDNWESDPDWKEIVYENRRLAVWSIVNTLTELGQYSRIQILIDTTGTLQGERPTQKMLGFVSGDDTADSQLSEPFSRNTQVLLTASSTLQLLLESFKAKEWEQVDELVASVDPLGYEKPSQSDMINTFKMLDAALVSYELYDEVVSSDGQSAVVMMDYKIQVKSNTVYEKTGMSMRLIKENGMWRLVYDSLEQLLNSAGS